MDIAVNGATVEFRGFLDEKTQWDAVKKSIHQALEASSTSELRLDFSGVKRANSVGILAWSKLLEQLTCQIVYVNTPIWLVEQFNLCDLLKENARVESLIAPFYCPENDSHELVTLIVGKDIPIQEDFSDFQISCKDAGGARLEADFEPREYFHFLALKARRTKGGGK